MSFKDEYQKEKDPSIKRIAEFLMKRANEDKFVAASLENEKKSLSGCYDYIKSVARKKAVKGCAVLEDSEVFYLAQHYYQESDDDLKNEKDVEIESVEKPVSLTVTKKPAKQSHKIKSNKKALEVDEKLKESGQLSLF